MINNDQIRVMFTVAACVFVFCILTFCLFQFVTLIPDQPGGWLLVPGPGSLHSSFELGWSFFNNRSHSGTLVF